jgi:hypothetical protein
VHPGKVVLPGSLDLDRAWHAKRIGLFAIQATQHPTHCEWGPSPLVNNIDPPGTAGQLGMRAITPTTLKRACDPRSMVKQSQ